MNNNVKELMERTNKSYVSIRHYIRLQKSMKKGRRN